MKEITLEMRIGGFLLELAGAGYILLAIITLCKVVLG